MNTAVKNDTDALLSKMERIENIQEIVSTLSKLCGHKMLGDKFQRVKICISPTNSWVKKVAVKHHFTFTEMASIENVWETLDRLLRSDEVVQATNDNVEVSLHVTNTYSFGKSISRSIGLEISKETLPTVLKVIGLYL